MHVRPSEFADASKAIRPAAPSSAAGGLRQGSHWLGLAMSVRMVLVGRAHRTPKPEVDDEGTEDVGE